MLLKVDQIETIVATVQPTNATNKRVTWESSDPEVATVDANGKVTAVAGGTATITVTSVADNTKKDTKQVIVGDLLVPAGGEITIQSVIDVAEGEKVIAVAPGTYEEQLFINKPLTLLGPNAGVSGTGARNAEAVIAQESQTTGLSPKLLITAENVIVKGFTFENMRINNCDDNQGTNEDLIGGVAIENNIFTNVVGTAIYLRDGRNAPGDYSENVRIRNNKIDAPSAGTEPVTDYNAGTGILVMGAENLVVSGNVITDAAYNGIQLARVNGSTISDNIVENSVQPALQIAQWNDGVHTVSGNTFGTKSKTKGAIRLYGFTHGYEPDFVINNNIIQDSAYGIQIGHGGASQSYNDIQDASYDLSGNDFTNISEHRLVIYLNSPANDNEKEAMDSLFAEVYGEGYQARAITDEDPFTYAVSILMVGEEQEFATIQDAVNAADEGDMILVGSGTFEIDNTLNITKPLTIKGMGPEYTVIDVTQVTGEANCWGVLVGKSNTVLCDLAIVSTDTDGRAKCNNLKVSGEFAASVEPLDSIAIENVVIEGGKGLDIFNADATLDSVTVKESKGASIAVSNGSKVTISNCTTADGDWGSVGVMYKDGYSESIVTVGDGNEFGEGLLYCEGYEAESKNEIDGLGVEWFSYVNVEKDQLLWVKELSKGAFIEAESGPNHWYATIQSAINAAAGGDTINILGDCTLIGATANNKELTFVGNSSKPKVTFPQKGYQTYYGCDFTFENLTLECEPDENYRGIQPDKVIARNCVINGKFWGYAKDLEFTDCIFNQETSYNIWTYGSNVTFENCEFNSAGRSVLIYNEGATLEVPAEIKFKNCTFSASSSVDRKAAIDIDTRFGSFNVKIENCSASGFSNETEEGGTVISEGFVHLKATDKGELTVSIDDKLVYPTVLNATHVGQGDRLFVPPLSDN